MKFDEWSSVIKFWIIYFNLLRHYFFQFDVVMTYFLPLVMDYAQEKKFAIA